MTLFLQAVAAGIGLGSVYALISLGYTLVLASSGVFNLAQGTLVMGGVLLLYELWRSDHLPFGVALVAICALGVLVGLAIYVLAIHPFLARGRRVTHFTETALVSTLGLSIALEAVAGLWFGYTTLPVRSYVSDRPFIVRGIAIRPIYLVMLGVSLLIFGLMEIAVRRTLVGIKLRAVVEDTEGAVLSGISPIKIVLLAFGAAGAFSALAGVLVAPVTSAGVGVASQLALFGFVGMAVGGFGSFGGALAGGLIVGLGSSVAGVYVDPSLVSGVVYLLMVAALLIRPSGLFGRAGAFGSARLREV